jgi:hypothetical protein
VREIDVVRLRLHAHDDIVRQAAGEDSQADEFAQSALEPVARDR